MIRPTLDPLALGLLVAAAALAGCGGAAADASASAPSSPPAVAAPVAPSLPVSGTADVELPEPGVALVHGARVAFDGIEEGLVWPALTKAIAPHKAGDVVTIQVARNVPIIDLLRAAWTVRAADVHVQSLDDTGVMHAVELRAKQDGAPAVSGCHLAVFVRPDGSLRVAAPGGPREITGEAASASLARSLESERAKCPIKYVAFGAESDAAPWGPVFDVLLAVDRGKSAGDARYVLGQAMHAPAR